MVTNATLPKQKDKEVVPEKAQPSVTVEEKKEEDKKPVKKAKK